MYSAGAVVLTCSRGCSRVDGRLDGLVGRVAAVVHEHVVGEAVVLPQRRLGAAALLRLMTVAARLGPRSVAL